MNTHSKHRCSYSAPTTPTPTGLSRLSTTTPRQQLTPPPTPPPPPACATRCTNSTGRQGSPRGRCG